jgi:hypothetical protein
MRSSRNKDRPPNPSKPGNKNAQSQYWPRWREFVRIANELNSNFLIACFTGALVLVGTIQLWSAFDADRPLVAVTKFEILQPVPGGVQVVVHFTNTGNSFAQSGKVRATYFMNAQPLPAYFDNRLRVPWKYTQPRSQFILPAKAEGVEFVAVTAKDWNDSMNGSKILAIVGDIEYKHFRCWKHLTEFCFTYNRDATQATHSQHSPAFDACPGHNDAD